MRNGIGLFVALCVASAFAAVPTSVAVNPSSGSGMHQTFTLTYSDDAGGTDIAVAGVIINSTATAAGSCYVNYYAQGDKYAPAKSIALSNDTATGYIGVVPIGSASVIENSQCFVNASMSNVAVTGTAFVLTLDVTFKSAFAGAQQIYMSATDAVGSAGPWVSLGSWNVTTSSTIDRFEFSPIASPQQVFVPFNVKITGRGPHAAMYSGEISLTSNMGDVDPTICTMTDGSADCWLTLNRQGSQVVLTASNGDYVGHSDPPFDVSGSGLPVNGGLYGRVTDGGGNGISGATVTDVQASSPATPLITMTDSRGFYAFTNVSPGKNTVSAELGGNTASVVVSLEPGETQTVALVIRNACANHGELTPILLVPGFMDSSILVSPIPYLPPWPISWDSWLWPSWSGRGTVQGIWDGLLDNSVGWKGLVDRLETATIPGTSSRYKLGCTIFAVPSDWRRPITEIAKDFLEPQIQRAKTVSGATKVNIVAHSMGGLVTRAYIQGPDWASDIDKFAVVATPHRGAAGAYVLWEGGDPGLVDRAQGSISGDGFQPAYSEVYLAQARLAPDWHTLEYLLFGLRGWVAQELSTLLGGSNAYTGSFFYKLQHKSLASVNNLLPVDPFLYHSATSGADSVSCDGYRLGEPNIFLRDLNEQNNPTLGRFGKAGDSGKVVTKVFAGTGFNTLSGLDVQSRKCGDSSKVVLYRDGAPLSNFPKFAPHVDYGDGTVTLKSADFSTLLPNAIEGMAQPLNTNTTHMHLVGAYKDEIIKFLVGPDVTWSASPIPIAAPNATAAPVLSVSTLGSAQPLVSDPAGHATGLDSSSNSVREEIPDTNLSLLGKSADVSISNPTDGQYAVDASSPYSEDYLVNLAYTSSSGTSQTTIAAFSHGSKRTFTFALDSASATPISILHAPSAPATLLASPAGTGSPTTMLTWTANSDPAVTQYNVYSRMTTEPHLNSIGSSTSPSFATSDPWAGDASIPVRIYAVAAVRADGSESFLSNLVANNDRDYDGLPDADEVAAGTDVALADSDGDGIVDGDENARGTDPNLPDTDHDSFFDGYEVKTGSDPLDATSTPKPNGDATGDGYVTVEDVFHLINYLFSPGASPVNGVDVNGDGKFDAADVFYLISYLFSGGPAPV